METTVQRVVTLGNRKQIPLGRYVAGIRDAIRHPDRTYRHGLCGWAPVTGAVFMPVTGASFMPPTLPPAGTDFR